MGGNERAKRDEWLDAREEEERALGLLIEREKREDE